MYVYFSEQVRAGTGSVTLFDVDGAPVEIFNIATGLGSQGGKVWISSQQLFINPNVSLVEGASYYLNIDATAIADYQGNKFAGVSNTSTLSFTTTATANTDSATPTLSYAYLQYGYAPFTSSWPYNGSDPVGDGDANNNSYYFYNRAMVSGTAPSGDYSTIIAAAPQYGSEYFFRFQFNENIRPYGTLIVRDVTDTDSDADTDNSFVYESFNLQTMQGSLGGTISGFSSGQQDANTFDLQLGGTLDRGHTYLSLIHI